MSYLFHTIKLFRQDSVADISAEKVKLPQETKRGRKAYQLGLRNEEVEIFGDNLLLADFLSGADVPDAPIGELPTGRWLANARPPGQLPTPVSVR